MRSFNRKGCPGISQELLFFPNPAGLTHLDTKGVGLVVKGARGLERQMQAGCAHQVPFCIGALAPMSTLFAEQKEDVIDDGPWILVVQEMALE